MAHTELTCKYEIGSLLIDQSTVKFVSIIESKGEFFLLDIQIRLYYLILCRHFVFKTRRTHLKGTMVNTKCARNSRS